MTALAALGELAEFIRGVTFKPEQVTTADDIEAVACLRTKNVQAQLETADLVFVPRSVVKNEAQMVRRGDIVISSANSWPLVGKSSWVGELDFEAAIGGFICLLRVTRNDIDARYLYRWFSSPRTQAIVRSFGQKTTNISNLNLDRALGLAVPLPPLPEQRRIAAILDQADELRTKRRRALGLFDELADSLFAEMSLSASAWEIVALGELTSIASGITKGRKVPDAPLRSVPYLTVANVQDKRLNLAVVKTIEASENEIDRYSLKPNDLLLTEGGDPDKLGRGTLWAGELSECIHQNHVFRVRVADGRIHPVYLNWDLRSARGRDYFLRSAKQTTGIASINSTQLKAFPVLVPALDVQTAFAARLGKLSEERRRCEEGVAAADELFASLQHRAFRGGL